MSYAVADVNIAWLPESAIRLVWTIDDSAILGNADRSEGLLSVGNIAKSELERIRVAFLVLG